jgi:hydrogenase-4 component F
MILQIYLISGLLITLLMFVPLFWRSLLHNVEAKTNWVNGLAILQAAFYLVLSIYVIVRVPLPFYDFKGYLMADNLAMYEVLTTSIVFLLAAVYGRGYVKALIEKESVRGGSVGLFYTFFNLLLIGIVFSFFSNNLALFWILLESTTVFSGVLIVVISARENIIAALKYVFIASTAMLFSVIGLIILFAMTKQATGSGTLNWNELMQIAGSLSPKYFTFAFIFMFIGFAAKAGIAPFHTWLPQAHARAPSVVSAVLSGVLLNCGSFGIIRLFAIAHRTESWKMISIILIVFGVISIAVAAFSMFSRTNIKKLIAFSSIEHMGLVLVGIGLGTPLALLWTLFHILAHSLIKTLLFFSAGILNHQYNGSKLQEMKNVFKLQPLAAWGIIIGSVAVTGMPPFPMFISKLMLFTQIGTYSLLLLGLLLVLFLIVAAAFAFLLVRSFTQQSEAAVAAPAPYSAHWTMKAPIILLFIALIAAGIYLSGGLYDVLASITASLGF